MCMKIKRRNFPLYIYSNFLLLFIILCIFFLPYISLTFLSYYCMCIFTCHLCPFYLLSIFHIYFLRWEFWAHVKAQELFAWKIYPSISTWAVLKTSQLQWTEKKNEPKKNELSQINSPLHSFPDICFNVL